MYLSPRSQVKYLPIFITDPTIIKVSNIHHRHLSADEYDYFCAQSLTTFPDYIHA